MGNRLIGGRTLWQLGKETTKGTAVAAKHQSTMPWHVDTAGQVLRPRSMRGFTMRYPGDALIVARGCTVSIDSHPVAFEEIHRIFGMSVKGGVSPSTSGSENTWIFNRLRTDVPSPDSFTLERRLHDGTSALDHEWPFLFMTGWTLKSDNPGPVTLQASGFCQGIQGSTLTDLSGTYPQAITEVSSARTNVYMDPLWANVGATAIGGEVKSIAVSFDAGFSPFRALDNNTNLDFTDVQFDDSKAGFNVDLTIYCKSGGADLFATLKTAAETLLAKAWQVRITGPVITSNPRLIQIGFFGNIEKETLMKTDLGDGQVLISMRIVETGPALSTDDWITCKVVNDKTASTY